MELLPDKGINTKSFRSVTVHARTLPDLWWLGLKEIIRVNIDKEGTRHLVNAYEVPVDKGSMRQARENPRRIQFYDFTGYIYEPWTDPRVPVLEGRPVAPASEKFVDEYKRAVMTTIKEKGEDYTYGEDLQPQAIFAIEYFQKHGPNHNHVTMRVGTSDTMRAYEQGETKTTQCLLSIDVKIINGCMWFFITFRSWDLFSGLPNNLPAFQALKEFMVSAIDRDWCQDGGIAVKSSGLHLYDDTWELAYSYVPEAYRIEADERG